MKMPRWERLFIPALLGFSLVLLGRHTGTAHRKEPTAGERVRYSTHIERLVAEKCLDCHGADSPEHRNFTGEDAARGVGPRLDTYSHLVALIGWPDTGLLQRNIDDGGESGEPGKMYTYLGSSDQERQKNLALFKSWAGNWILKRWPEVTKDELSRLKLAY